MTPTIGRKVWFYGFPGGDAVQLDSSLPMDATVVYASPGYGDICNLLVLDHVGKQFPVQGVLRMDHTTAYAGYVHWDWMPFQKGQAAKEEIPPGLMDRVKRLEDGMSNRYPL